MTYLMIAGLVLKKYKRRLRMLFWDAYYFPLILTIDTYMMKIQI